MADPNAKYQPAHVVHRNPRLKVEGKVNTYRAKRYLKVNGKQRAPGELVPEAHTWLRVDNATHSGYLQEVQVSESAFDAAVKKYCPGLKTQLADKAKGIKMSDKDREATEDIGFRYDQDGQIYDVAAARRFALEQEVANTAPNDRPAIDQSGGTPAATEMNSPDHMHSDGGPTLWSEKTAMKEPRIKDKHEHVKKDREVSVSEK